MPWENTEQYIRSGHREPEEFQTDTLKTIPLNEKEGIKAIIGKPKGKDAMEILSYIFEKDKGWTIEKAKEWFEKHHTPAKEHIYAVLPFAISEKIMEKPLRIRGLAMTAGMSKNFNIYTPEELQSFAGKLVDAPVYIEHVTVPNEGVNGDFRILSVEYQVDAKTQTLETALELGREAPLLADYVFALRSKMDHLSKYKTARHG